MISLMDAPKKGAGELEWSCYWRSKYHAEKASHDEVRREKNLQYAKLLKAELRLKELESELADRDKQLSALRKINEELLRENRKYCRELNRRKGSEGYFGSSTPSAMLPPGKSTPEENHVKKGGAWVGHVGCGRKNVQPEDIDEHLVIDELPEYCDCGGSIENNGFSERQVCEYIPSRLVWKSIKQRRGKCLQCGRSHLVRYDEAAPHAKYGYSLIAHAACEHYLFGHTLGEVTRRLGIGEGTLLNAFHRTAGFFAVLMTQLYLFYRAEFMRYADETHWKTDGANGYAWVFATAHVIIFLYAHTRAGEVPRTVLGDKPLDGILSVDRYAAYNQIKCKKQYCFAHLKRKTDDAGKEFKDDQEVQAFAVTFSALLSKAMSLRRKVLDVKEFLVQAEIVKNEIIQCVEAEANHPGIQEIQNIFRQNRDNLYHWATSPDIPAENNFAERTIRKTVIARKNSFGSQSDRGRETRSVLSTILHTAALNGLPPAETLTTLLKMAQNNQPIDLVQLLIHPTNH